MARIWYLYVHEVALFVSDIAMLFKSNWLFERGGNLELWAEEHLTK